MSTRDKRQASAAVPDPSWLNNPASPNYVPPEARDANAIKLLPLWPAPNVSGTNLYRTTITNSLDTRQEFVRADYNLTDRWSLTGRYLHDGLDSRGEYVTGPNLEPGHRRQAGHLAVIEARHAPGRVLYEMSYQSSGLQLARKDVVHTRDDVGLLIPEYFPENASHLVPTIQVAGVSPLLGSVAGVVPGGPREYLNDTFNSAITLQRASHTLKMGGLVALERLASNLIEKTTQGYFLFQPGGRFTAFQNFLRGNVDGACGDACTYSETDTDVINRFRSNRYEVYAQDTWRTRHHITVDLGLRYAFYVPVADENDKLLTFSPETYDPAQVPTFADPDANFVVVGTGNLFNGIRVVGADSPYGRHVYAADKNNLQPRVGVAWDPRGQGRLVLRAGYGMYFDKTQLAMFAQNVQDGFTFSDPFRTDVFAWNASLSNPGRGATTTPYAVLAAQPLATSESYTTPRSQHWNVGLQRRLYSHAVLDVGYVAGRGDHLLRYVDINKPNATDEGGPANLVRPFLGYEAIFMRETTAKSRYHGLLASFRHDAGRSGSVTVNYTLSQNKADATYDNDAIDDPQNPRDVSSEFGAARTDRTHILNAYYVYALPFARGTTSGWRNGLLGGWQIAGITRIESGPAARIQVPNCNYDGWCVGGALRPNQVGDPGAGDQQGLLWFDPSAFVPPPATEYGTAPVAPLRLPGRYQWDFTVSKTLSLAGRTRLQFRADFINAFNQTQFLDVNTTCFQPSGTTTCDPKSGFGKVTSTRPPRDIQLGVRFDW